MGKAAGAMGLAFTLGTGVVALMGAALGGQVEAAVVGVVGLALYASSALLNGRATAPTGSVAKQA